MEERPQKHTNGGRGVDGAIKFLEKLDSDKGMRQAIKKLNHVIEFAKRHNYEFTNDDLQEALLKKWGRPNCPHNPDDPHTCCCVSEVPGF